MFSVGEKGLAVLVGSVRIRERKQNKILDVLGGLVYDLPVRKNSNVWWNFGSLLGFCLFIQLASGLFLAIHYIPNVNEAFSSVDHIMRNVSGGFIIRRAHANGASFFFIFIYVHIARGIYYGSYMLIKVWGSGVLLLLLLMATAFLGYVLPWGQMSLWGATVICNLVTAVPYVGKDIVSWLWGGYCIDTPTLTRFYAFHFLLAFVMVLVVVFHVIFLHDRGRNNPIGSEVLENKVPFHNYFSSKDILGFAVYCWVLMAISFILPDLFIDPENYTPANPMETPVHIQPE